MHAIRAPIVPASCVHLEIYKIDPAESADFGEIYGGIRRKISEDFAMESADSAGNPRIPPAEPLVETSQAISLALFYVQIGWAMTRKERVSQGNVRWHFMINSNRITPDAAD